MNLSAETHSKLTRVGGGVGDGARGGVSSRPTVDPKSPYYPSLPELVSLTRLQHLETAQIEDALSLNAIARRMAKRGPEIRRLAAGLFGGGS